MREQPAISIVICFYDRCAMVRDAVESCLAQEAAPPFEVIVADNSPGGIAPAALAGLEDARLRVVPAAPPNISAARNAGVEAARGALVAFLDDDEIAGPGWLRALAATLEHSGADVAAGPVLPVVEGLPADAAPVPPAALEPFRRWIDAPDGAPLTVSDRGKTRGLTVGAGNTLWRTAVMGATPFDLGFGASGGEDFDLLLRVEAAGARVVWSPEAAVHERVPAGRLGLRYGLVRSYSGGQVYAAAAIRNSRTPAAKGASVMARALAQCCALPLTVAAAALRGDPRPALERGAGAMGKLLWWRKIPLYRLQAPS